MKLEIMLKNLRESRNLAQNEAAKSMGISNVALSQYERGVRRPDIETLAMLADFYGVSLDYLIGKDVYVGTDKNLSGVRIKPNTNKKIVTINVLGHIPAGVPLEAIQEIIDTMEIEIALSADPREYFALQVKGDSMEPLIRDGYIVVCKKQSCVENNEVAVVMVNGYDATLKRVKYFENGLSLIAENPIYPPRFFSADEVEKLPITVLGKVIEFTGKL